LFFLWAINKYFKGWQTIIVILVVSFNFKKSLKGQSHEKVGELRVWGVSLGPG
jgi:hypothetical protein